MSDETTTIDAPSTPPTDAPATAQTDANGSTGGLDPDWDDIPDAPAPEKPAASTNDTPAADAGDSRGESKASSEPAPADDGFDASLMDHAKAAGFTEEEARAFGSPVNLQKALIAFDRAVIGVARQQSSETTQQATTPSSTAPNASAQQTPAPNAEFNPKELGLPDDLDPEVITAFKNLHSQFASQREADRKELDALRQGYQFITQQLQAQTRVADLQFAAQTIQSMGDEYKSLLEGKEAQAKLEEVVETAYALKQGYERRGIALPDATTLVKRAIGSVFQDKVLEIAKARTARAVAQRKKGDSSPPTHRKPKETGDPLEDARRAARSKLLEFGVKTDAPEADDEW